MGPTGLASIEVPFAATEGEVDARWHAAMHITNELASNSGPMRIVLNPPLNMQSDLHTGVAVFQIAEESLRSPCGVA
jgi:hypothetical protein